MFVLWIAGLERLLLVARGDLESTSVPLKIPPKWNPQETFKAGGGLGNSLQQFCLWWSTSLATIQVTAAFLASCAQLSLFPDCGIQLVGPPLVFQQCPHQGVLHPSPWAFAVCDILPSARPTTDKEECERPWLHQHPPGCTFPFRRD